MSLNNGGIIQANSDDQIDISGGYKPSNLRKQSTVSNNGPNVTNKYNQQNGNAQFDSPKAIKKITSTPNVINNINGTNGSNGQYTSSNSASSSNGSTAPIELTSPLSNYEKLKQELILEFRKELQTFKADIINCKLIIF